MFTSRCLATVVGLALLLAASNADAQEAVVYTNAGVDGNATDTQLIGGSVRFGTLGLQPLVGLQGYRLRYDVGNDAAVTVYSVTPSAGLTYGMTGGSVEARVGYNFQNRDAHGPSSVEREDGGGGVVVTSQVNSWATRPEIQAIASYSIGSEYLWSQLAAMVPVSPAGARRILIGAEVVGQGETGHGSYRSYQFGPALRIGTSAHSSITIGAGYKDTNTREGTYYARISAVRYGIRF